ncbi:MAG: SDR family NAD(P)-dependent oxidoreductase, partial [Actinomycetota bacterium]|nr:SDR family NAD(P)-dependent oxidoreductase [Actinomycetota bacterium]
MVKPYFSWVSMVPMAAAAMCLVGLDDTLVNQWPTQFIPEQVTVISALSAADVTDAPDVDPIDADKMRSDAIEPVILDITAPEEVASIAARIGRDSENRPLRAIVNNAGIAVNAPVEVLPLAQWRHQFEVNLFGHIAVTQALLPALISSRGTIVNITS